MQITSELLLKGPLLEKESGLSKEGVLGLISDVWMGTCQEVGSYHKFCFFYIIYILFMKPECFGPISLTKVPSVPTQATVQALVSELENPSRFSVSGLPWWRSG